MLIESNIAVTLKLYKFITDYHMNQFNALGFIFSYQPYPEAAIQTVNFGSKIVKAKHVFGKNIFCSMKKDKIGEERIFQIVHFPIEG